MVLRIEIEAKDIAELSDLLCKEAFALLKKIDHPIPNSWDVYDDQNKSHGHATINHA
jgi:hypothetical protein